MNIEKLIMASFWAGVISLDFTAFGPFMISQPLVCGPLFGWLMGNVAVGVIIGGIMQLLWMDLSPVGVGIPYDSTAATILAVYWACLPGHGSLSQIVLTLAVAAPFGFLFRWVDQMARRVNTLIMHRVDRFPDENLPLGLWLGIAGGVTWSLARYAAVYALCFGVGEYFWKKLAYVPRLGTLDQGLTMAIILLPVAGMGVTLELFLSDEPESRWSRRRPSKPVKKEIV